MNDGLFDFTVSDAVPRGEVWAIQPVDTPRLIFEGATVRAERYYKISAKITGLDSVILPPVKEL